jgi:cell division protein FtsI (penicillin-binding protein 3)
MDIKNEVLYRVYFLLFGIIIPLSLILLYRTIYISVWEGDDWRAVGEDNYVKYKEVEADRGNIFSEDGSVLATSIPYFDIYFDPVAPTDKDFEENLDSLAYCLATFIDPSYTVGGYRDRLIRLRQDSTDRHVLIKRKVSYSEKRKIESYPLFSLGQFRGGFIAERRSDRRRPFGLLAQRTIGYVRDGAKDVGLEGYFNDYLGGEPGGQFMICVDTRRDLWMPLDDLSAIDPKSGDDVHTTIDVNLQDIVENALLRAMNYHKADWGTAIMMDVETGAVRSIANLGKYSDTYWETYNHAVGSGVEPGSTFKTASMLALLEDGHVNLTDTVFINKGIGNFYEETMRDASSESYTLDTVSARRAFEISSNVGIAKLVNKHYGVPTEANQEKAAGQFIERLKSFNLHLPTEIEIAGEASPFIKEAYNSDDQWSGTTLPWMSIGYELKISPLQLLTFYNAIANDGRMMKPYLVDRIERYGETIEQFKPTVIKRKLASDASVNQMQSLLRGVVDSGTAVKLATPEYDFAGKTGTAQINYTRISDRTLIGGYQASFAGYFPADDPKYSVIVVINNPREHGFYGGDVAGPVFREIADRTMATRIDLHQALNTQPKPLLTENQLPGFDVGAPEDMTKVLTYLDLTLDGVVGTDLAMIRPSSDTLKLYERNIPEGRVQAVTGMGLREALFVLENLGLKVEVDGYGKVTRQSIKPGTPVRGQTIRLYLRL